LRDCRDKAPELCVITSRWLCPLRRRLPGQPVRAVHHRHRPSKWTTGGTAS